MEARARAAPGCAGDALPGRLPRSTSREVDRGRAPRWRYFARKVTARPSSVPPAAIWPEQWIRILGHRVLKLDVKEFSRKKRDDEGLWKGFGVELGQGDCDWPAVVAALDEIGYEGWASAEVAGGDADRLREIRERMDRILAR